jgi:Rho-binding antiterminator
MNCVSADPEYAPVACAFHESLEFAVLRRIRLHLVYRGQDGVQEVQVMPTDVATRDGAEWLSYRLDTGDIGVVRLDRIVSAEPLKAATG